MAYFDKDHVFEVGERVLVFDAYSKGGPSEGTVVKVGRKLLHVDVKRYYGTSTFRLDAPGGRHSNSEHGNRWVLTPHEAERRKHESDVVDRLRDHGFAPVKWGGFSQPLDTLEKVLDLLDREAES